jgi:hypothetical protein
MSIKTKNTEAYMKSYAEKLVGLLKKEMATPQQDRSGYDNPAIDATGEGSRSLKVVDYGKGIFEIVGKDYLLEVEKGTKTAEVNEIAEWIVAKPVRYETKRFSVTLRDVNDPTTRRLASRITEKINKVGTRPNNFIERTVNAHLKNLKLIEPVVADVKDNVEALLMEAGFDLKGKTIKFV